MFCGMRLCLYVQLIKVSQKGGRDSKYTFTLNDLRGWMSNQCQKYTLKQWKESSLCIDYCLLLYSEIEITKWKKGIQLKYSVNSNTKEKCKSMIFCLSAVSPIMLVSNNENNN